MVSAGINVQLEARLVMRRGFVEPSRGLQSGGRLCFSRTERPLPGRFRGVLRFEVHSRDETRNSSMQKEGFPGKLRVCQSISQLAKVRVVRAGVIFLRITRETFLPLRTESKSLSQMTDPEAMSLDFAATTDISGCLVSHISESREMCSCASRWGSRSRGCCCEKQNSNKFSKKKRYHRGEPVPSR